MNGFQNGNSREPIPMSYKRSSENGSFVSNFVILLLYLFLMIYFGRYKRKLIFQIQQNPARINGTGPPTYYTPRDNNDRRSIDESSNIVKLERSQSSESNLSTQAPKNPRGGVIGRTPTPPSAPTPVYEKDEKYFHIFQFLTCPSVCFFHIHYFIVRGNK